MKEPRDSHPSRFVPPRRRLRALRRRPIVDFEPLEERQLLTVWGPLIQFTTWDQSDHIGTSSIHYNQYCPVDPGTGYRSVAGCGPIAEAQLVYFWQYPKSLTFSSPADSYVSAGNYYIYIDDDASYLSFPNFTALSSHLSNITYSGDPTEEAMLAFGLGVKDQANYSSDATGSVVDMARFTALGYQSVDESASWTATKPTVISNIKAGLPVLLTIRGEKLDGHYVILDGYNDSTESFHTNFGWGGAADGWYTPPDFGTVYGFNAITDVLYNLCPKLSAPTGLTATQGVSTDPVHLSWRAAPVASGYEVWRNTSTDLTAAKKIATIPGDATSFNDETPPDGTTQIYFYWIRTASGQSFSSYTPYVRGFRSLVSVEIPDAKLLAAIRTALNKPVDAISNLDLLTLHSLSAPGAAIQNITGLGYATFLTSVDLSNNAITDAAPLASVHTLTTLHLDNNKVSSASFLTNLTSLTALTLDKNQLSDLSPLSGLTKLTTLSFDNNLVSDLSPLVNMKLLSNLSFDNNHVSSLTPLASVRTLTSLSFAQNQIADLTPLSAMRILNNLVADNNLIADLSTLATDAYLKTVSLKGNRLFDITPLTSLTRLTQLDVSSNYLDISSGSATSALIGSLVQKGITVTSAPQNLPPQALALTLPFTTVTYTLGKPANLALTLKCPTAPKRPYSGTATVEDAADTCLASATVSTAGKVTWSLSNVAPGTYTCTVNFPGDVNHCLFESATFTLVVLPASTKTTLATSVAAPVFGQNYSLTATVIPASSPGTPRTGTVTFYEGTTPLGTVPLGANSQAVLPLTASLVGTHKYTATYNGDSNFNPSNSKAVSVKVQKDAVAAQPLAGAGSTVLVGQLFTLSAAFAVLAPGAGIPTGLATFKDGGKILASILLDPTGAAQCTVALSTAGKHKITVSYVGDANDKPAVSAAVYQIVTPAATSTLFAVIPPGDTVTPITSAAPATPVTLVATVSRLDPSTGIPVGKVQFKDGTKILATVALKNGSASFTTSKLLLGTHSLTATFLTSPTDLTSLNTTTLQIL